MAHENPPAPRPSTDSNPKRVVAKLRTDPSRSLCDDCLALETEIPNRHAVAAITGTLQETSEFEREQGRCSRCREMKLVIHAVR